MSGTAHAAPRALRLGRREARAAERASQPLERSLLQTATLCLLALGVVMVFSASSTTSLLGETGDGAFFVKRTIIFGAIGLAVMHALSIGGLRLIRLATPAILAGSVLLLLLVLLPGFGLEANGATRWIGVGPLQLQPSELAKLALILYGAALLAKRPRTVASIGEMMPYLVVTGLVGGLILVEPDLGTALVAAFAVTALLIAGGARLRHLALIGAVIGVLALIAILIEPYRQDRIAGFLDPGGDAAGAGFQGTQATIALGSGGLFGVGLGESVQKAFYLPEAHTDMIAAVIGEEAGLFGLAVLVGLYGLFAYAGFRIAQRARDRYGKLLAAGLTAMILAQATLNLFAVIGLAPLTGVPLPFVSYGNSSLIVMLAAVGLILNVARGASSAPPAADAAGVESQAPARRSSKRGSTTRRRRESRPRRRRESRTDGGRSGARSAGGARTRSSGAARLHPTGGGRRRVRQSTRNGRDKRGNGPDSGRGDGGARRSGDRRRRRPSR